MEWDIKCKVQIQTSLMWFRMEFSFNTKTEYYFLYCLTKAFTEAGHENT